jgi:hypothetical protein
MQVSEIQLIGDKLLVRPLRKKTKLQVQHVPEEIKVDQELIDAAKKAGVPPPLPEAKLVAKEVPVVCEIQKAVVLAVGDIVGNTKVGDTILYHIKTGVPFDYVNNTLLLRSYDLIGVINKQIE